MRISTSLLIILFSFFSVSAQIGIGTTTPKAQLDIVASNQTTPANTDGILVPRVDAFPVTSPTVEQNGMLVFLTTDKTFYYWNHGNTAWVAVNNPNGVVRKIDDLSDGKSDSDGSQDGSSVFLGINAGAADDGTDNQNVGVGFHSLYENIGGGWNTTTGYFSMSKNETGSNNTATGSKALYSNSSGNKNTAIGNSTVFKNETGSNNTTLGSYTLFENISGNNNVALGFNAGYNETGSNKLYIENSNADANNALIYGDFGINNTSTGNILRTNSQFQIGVPDTGSGETGYAFPIADGTANQILETDGSGNLGWIDNRPVSSISMSSGTGGNGISNTVGNDVNSVEAGLEPSIYNSSGNIEVKLVIRYISKSAITVNFQLRAHDGTTETYPIVAADAWSWATTQTGGVVTSPWKTWSAGTNAQEIHLHAWVDSGGISINNVYLMVRSQ